MGALEAFAWEWGSALIRWLHVTAAIAWIGGSFFFMHLDASLRKHAGDNPALAGVSWQVHGGGFYQMSKYMLAPAALPDELIWHKWESYWTWMSGFALLCWVYYGQSTFFLIDPAVLPLAPWQAALIGIAALALGWIVYDFLCRSPLGDNDPLLALVGFGYVWRPAGFFPGLLRPRGADPHRRPDGDDDDRQCLLRHHAEPAQERGRADRGQEARPEMGEDLEDALDPQQLHHASRAVPDAVEPLPDDLLEPEGHPGDRHLHHRRGRDHPLFLQRLAPRPREGAVVGLGGRGAGDRLRFFFAATASPGMRELMGLAELPVAAARADEPKAPQEVVDIVTMRCSMCHAPAPMQEIGEAPKGVVLDTPSTSPASRRRSACRRC